MRNDRGFLFEIVFFLNETPIFSNESEKSFF